MFLELILWKKKNVHSLVFLKCKIYQFFQYYCSILQFTLVVASEFVTRNELTDNFQNSAEKNGQYYPEIFIKKN